jgi:hypothetical protein
LELVGAPSDWDGVSAPGVPVLGLWDSEAVCALAGKASITPKTARLGSSNSLRTADRRMIDPRRAETNVQQHTYMLIGALRGHLASTLAARLDRGHRFAASAIVVEFFFCGNPASAVRSTSAKRKSPAARAECGK